MKKSYLRFFALSLVSLCIAIVFYTQGGVSLAKSLLFYFSGVASGANLVQGIFSLRKSGN